MNLFEIQANIDRILEYAAENGGDIGESGAEELAISEEELGEKLYAYSFVIDRYNTDIALLKQYKQALDDRVKRTEKKIKRLKDVMVECAYKYGEPVLKKNTETGIKEPTDSMSLKYPNITISVRKGQEVVTDTEMFNSFLNQMYQYFENPSVDTVPANIDIIKGFIDVKLDKGLNFD
uniref:siphovirus Gp157 family protein n=1 Tax=Lachnospira sp. TaxID=2049031 RepID=UPI003FF003D0